MFSFKTYFLAEGLNFATTKLTDGDVPLACMLLSLFITFNNESMRRSEKDYLS